MRSSRHGSRGKGWRGRKRRLYRILALLQSQERPDSTPRNNDTRCKLSIVDWLLRQDHRPAWLAASFPANRPKTEPMVSPKPARYPLVRMFPDKISPAAYTLENGRPVRCMTLALLSTST